MNLDNPIDPVQNLYDKDLEHTFYSFCSYICMYTNRKQNIANIFLHVLDNEEIKKLYISLGDHKTKYEAIRSFLTIEPSLQKSKYIKRYINKNVETT